MLNYLFLRKVDGCVFQLQVERWPDESGLRIDLIVQGADGHDHLGNEISIAGHSWPRAHLRGPVHGQRGVVRVSRREQASEIDDGQAQSA